LAGEKQRPQQRKKESQRATHRAQAAARGRTGARTAAPPLDAPASVTAFDIAAAALVILFAMAMVIRPLPNLDLYWLLAVGRRIVETQRYIYQDPFTFTVTGSPWSPLSYLSGIIFYALSKVGGMTAIAVLRLSLVGALAWLSFRTLRRSGVAWALAAPLVLVALINAHSRLTDRGQIFEYVFIAWLMGFLLTSHEWRGKSFFVVPLLVQLAWVQLHSSFLLGPVLAAIFFASEWVAPHTHVTRALARHDWKRAALLVALMALVCVVNPNPKAFLIQPFDPTQRDLMTRYTLEWKSPFDASMKFANFHPYYELVLGGAALAVVLRIASLPLAPVAMMAATALLSFQSHRFRVEFALVAVPMIALLLRDAPLVATVRRIWPSRAMWSAIGIALLLSMMVAERARVLESQDMPELYPKGAMDFVARENVARRPFATVGFGSYMLWELYGERPTFIDGRNFNAQLYQDFLTAQTRETSWRAINRKYKPDAFILPPPEHAVKGLQNLHVWLSRAADWPLVYRDDRAWVYVAAGSVDPAWLAQHQIKP
jgi:hypothetical protein